MEACSGHHLRTRLTTLMATPAISTNWSLTKKPRAVQARFLIRGVAGLLLARLRLVVRGTLASTPSMSCCAVADKAVFRCLEAAGCLRCGLRCCSRLSVRVVVWLDFGMARNRSPALQQVGQRGHVSTAAACRQRDGSVSGANQARISTPSFANSVNSHRICQRRSG